MAEITVIVVSIERDVAMSCLACRGTGKDGTGRYGLCGWCAGKGVVARTELRAHHHAFLMLGFDG